MSSMFFLLPPGRREVSHHALPGRSRVLAPGKHTLRGGLVPKGAVLRKVF